MSAHRVFRRTLWTLALAMILTFAFAASAFAAPPVVTNAKFSNPVAYELKSLLSTRFTCDLATAGTWGTLDILGANGVVKTVYSGPLTTGTNWLPLWNGLDSAGRRLPSASYDWRLTVSKGGEVTVVRGKITISKIQFVVKGRLADMETDWQYRYMVPGSANIYWQFTNYSSDDTFYFDLNAPSGYNIAWAVLDFGPYETLKGTWYLRPLPDGTDIKDRGMHEFQLSVHRDVSYYMTVIQ